jgi:N6-L-threonylcarbamoyladenine synthase
MQFEPCTLLAIESSCDETSASVIKDGKILSNIIATQAIHEKYGGVVPELASREHQKNIVPVVTIALKEANINLDNLDAIAFTKGPGLLGSLLVGSSFAKSIAWAKNIPLIEVQHMQAHILAHFIDEPQPTFPFLCLTVSGGHTQIVLVKNYLEMEILGETQDDAVGEAFDKTAKIMGLPYPGGPLIDKYAKEGNPQRFSFPQVEMPELHFSFSGIKTAFLNFLHKNTQQNPNFIQENLSDICASIQHTLLQILIKKLKKASLQTNIQNIAIAGGVSANSGLRKLLQEEGEKNNWKVFIPDFQYCTDNAAMIAITAYFKYQNKIFTNQNTSPLARMEF